MDWDGIVGIVTCYGPDCWGISPSGGEILCSPPSGIGDHPAMQWVPGFFQGCKAAGV